MRLGQRIFFTTRPDTIKVRLPIQTTLIDCRSFNITNKYRQTARQFLLFLFRQHLLYCIKACGFIAML